MNSKFTEPVNLLVPVRDAEAELRVMPSVTTPEDSNSRYELDPQALLQILL